MTDVGRDVARLLQPIVGAAHVLLGDAITDGYTHDEALGAAPERPLAVVRPSSTQEVAAVMRVAAEHRIPVTARGSGTGLSGSCTPRPDGLLVSFERMDRILEVDDDNFTATVQPGVQLQQLDAELRSRGLVYPVYPGEYSASLGGNVGTNAGGMRAVKYGVTRQHILGVEAVLATGEVITCGGKATKSSSGYDLTQLIVGSEGTLALVTQAWLRLQPRPAHGATLLAPFATLDEVMDAVPKLVGSGIDPLILEYIDLLTMDAATREFGLQLNVADDVKATALAYLVVGLEDHRRDRIEEDTEAAAELLSKLGAMDVFVLPPSAAAQLIEARERAFWMAKALGADDIIDVVVPRTAMPAFMAAVKGVADASGSLIAGCGHAGDGNVHMAVFQPDPGVRSQVLTDVFRAGIDLGGAISGEHGIGRSKRDHFLELEDPVKVQLMRQVKAAFDPHGLLNPGAIFTLDAGPEAGTGSAPDAGPAPATDSETAPPPRRAPSPEPAPEPAAVPDTQGLPRLEATVPQPAVVPQAAVVPQPAVAPQPAARRPEEG